MKSKLQGVTKGMKTLRRMKTLRSIAMLWYPPKVAKESFSNECVARPTG
jgi:hypothetical protein